MDAEEKKSLPSTGIRTSQSKQTGFRLHYFPDIPIDDGDNVRRELPLKKNFQRNQNENMDSSCKNLASGLAGNETSFRNRSLSAAEQSEQAYQRGFADGKKQGMIEGESKGFKRGEIKIEPLLKSLQEALMQLKNIREETYQCVEKEVVELALAIAKQVICREVKLDREIVVCVAREALAKVEDPGRIRIKMSPSDLQFINEIKHQFSNLISHIDDVTFEAEESIQSGGCIIETDLGEIDARIDKQLQAVEESFRAATEKPSGGG